MGCNQSKTKESPATQANAFAAQKKQVEVAAIAEVVAPAPVSAPVENETESVAPSVVNDEEKVTPNIIVEDKETLVTVVDAVEEEESVAVPQVASEVTKEEEIKEVEEFFVEMTTYGTFTAPVVQFTVTETSNDIAEVEQEVVITAPVAASPSRKQSSKKKNKNAKKEHSPAKALGASNVNSFERSAPALSVAAADQENISSPARSAMRKTTAFGESSNANSAPLSLKSVQFTSPEKDAKKKVSFKTTTQASKAKGGKKKTKFAANNVNADIEREMINSFHRLLTHADHLQMHLDSR